MHGGSGPYGTSKLAALGIAEALQRELAMREGALDKVTVVALCPAIVTTELLDSSSESEVSSSMSGMTASAGDRSSELSVGMFRAVWAQGMSADHCADEVLAHAHDGRFYCILDNVLERDGMAINLDERITARYRDVMARTPPSIPSVMTGLGSSGQGQGQGAAEAVVASKAARRGSRL